MSNISNLKTVNTIKTGLYIKREYLSFSSLCCFILPLMTIPRIQLVGQLLLSDIIVLILLFLMVISRNFNFKQPYLWTIIFFLSLWFLGAVVSDFVNNTSFSNLIRGWSKILFFGCYVVAFFVLINGRYERYVAALIGISFTFILNWILQVNEVLIGHFWGQAWKFGVGYAISMLLMIVIQVKFKSIKLQSILVILISPIHLFLAARSLFLTVFLSGIIGLIRRKIYNSKNRKISMAILLIGVGVMVPITNLAYDQLVRTGIFGQEVLEKHIMQTEGGGNIILNGRSESIISIRAINDSPIFGHGSWAQSEHYYFEYNKLLEQEGKNINWERVLSKDISVIPSHSHLLGAWVENGIFGGVFWLFMIIIMFRALIAGLFGLYPTKTFEFLALIWTIWNILFSPFGTDQRCFFAIYLVIAIMMIVRQDDKLLVRFQNKGFH